MDKEDNKPEVKPKVEATEAKAKAGVAEVKPKVEANGKEKKKPEVVIYVGPSMMERTEDGQISFMINANTIYNNGLPAEVKKRQEEDKDFKRLFIPVAKASTIMRELTDTTSAMATCRDRVTKAYYDRQKLVKKEAN